MLIAAAVPVVGLQYGARTAGGSDSYGYVSEARLLASGRLRLPEPLMTDESWVFGHHMLAPLGWVRAPDRQSIVPTYPPGYPLVMAAFERLLGPSAVYLVVPLLGGVAVLATYAMGLRYAGPGVGLMAAILLATSPTLSLPVDVPDERRSGHGVVDAGDRPRNFLRGGHGSRVWCGCGAGHPH